MSFTMSYSITTTWDALDRFIGHAETHQDQIEKYWDEDVVDPIWSDLSQWAPFDVSFMRPKVIKDIATLKIQNALLKQLDLHLLHQSTQRIMQSLPQPDEESLLIALFPLRDEAESNQRHNGVLGTGVFGNIILNLNPLAEHYQQWIPYVLAHEYHHCFWGGIWYGQKHAAKGNLLEALLTEGQADYFATRLFPQLQPAWITAYSPEEFEHYASILKEHFECTDRNRYAGYVFGNAEKQLPWCIGYSIGYQIICQVAEKTEKAPQELAQMSCDEIYAVFANYCV